ncbi:hypothetical protein ES319_A13G152400v1 [Gossypium barbadense]|uniref:Uncharacterized protein n=1 Tax=Gossypium barbadense TaxID=3634 RepID=A0A5J5T2S7_GOSBA|nr:hypothetical protein ES319_A13G152400v1 [Gossypium barbadense]
MEPLVDDVTKKFTRSISHAKDELQSFRTYLKWMCVDQSNIWTTCLSWFLFIFLGLVVCLIFALSFVCLTRFVKTYGLKRFLFFDKLYVESEAVRKGYTGQLNRSLKIVAVFVLPCFIAETAYKVWWYASGASQIPFLGIVWLSDTVACITELFSWLYRTTVFFLVCVLFHLICNLQVLRLRDFAQVFQIDSDVGSVLSEHLWIRRHLRIISHRYRAFIICCLILITGSQFTSLLITTKATSALNFYKAGELALCSITLLTGLCILLRSATKITHKAQAITCLAAKWHACATLDANEDDMPRSPSVIQSHQPFPHVGTDGESDDGDDLGDEDDIDNNKMIPSYAYSTLSFQKRQALVTYFENNRAGITIYGFVLDRSTLHTIFGLELSLVLWLLGKTIVSL